MIRGRTLFIAIVTPLVGGGLFVALLCFLMQSIVAEARTQLLPYEFSAEVYETERSGHCPGDTIAWTETITINAPFESLVGRLWVNPERFDETYSIRGAGVRQLVYRGSSELDKYYLDEFGVEVVTSDYPLSVTARLTETVPLEARPGPLVLIVSPILETRQGDNYAVPVLVLSEDECLG